MTIQISVVLWTMICFTFLYFMLNNLLFKPILALIDQRKLNLENARAEYAVFEQQREQEMAVIAEANEAEAARLQKNVDEQPEKITLEGKNLLEEVRKNRIETVKQYRAELDEKYALEGEDAEGNFGELADSYLSNLYAEP